MRRLGYVVAMMACLVTVACGGERFPTAASSTPSSLGSAPPVVAASESAALRRDSLAGADLGPDWSITANELKTAPSSASDCSPGTVLPPFTVVQTEEVAYKFSYGAEAGHVTLIVSVSPTAADIAERIRKVERLPDFAACLKVGVLEDFHDAAGRDGSVEGAATAPLALPTLASVTNSYRTVVQYHFAGAAKVGFVDQFYLQRGRALVVVVFTTCCKPFDDAFEARILNLVDTRLRPDFG